MFRGRFILQDANPMPKFMLISKKLGIKDEIDLIAISSLDRQVTVAEVECNHKKIDMSILKEKAKQIWTLFPRYKRQTVGLSLEDM